MATYNASMYVKNCLDSIVPQLNEETELIIIDGDSKDGTQGIIMSFGDKVNIFISEPDEGIYDAWNKGINLSCGDWIMFIGADDRLLPTAISRYLSILDNLPDSSSYDYICAKNKYVNHNGQIVSILGQPPKWNMLRKGMVAAHVGSLHSRSNLFETIGLFNTSFKICADYELLLRKKMNLKWWFSDEIMAEMRTGGVSFSMAAIQETYAIRKYHRSISFLRNVFLFCWDILTYLSFFIRKSLIAEVRK